MKANNYNEIAARIDETIERTIALEKNWDDDSYTYDELMKEEYSVMRITKAIAEDLGFSIEWGDFKSSCSAGELLRDMKKYVGYTIQVIEEVRSQFRPDIRFGGAAHLVKKY